jgi:hypothetical protein
MLRKASIWIQLGPNSIFLYTESANIALSDESSGLRSSIAGVVASSGFQSGRTLFALPESCSCGASFYYHKGRP